MRLVLIQTRARIIIRPFPLCTWMSAMASDNRALESVLKLVQKLGGCTILVRPFALPLLSESPDRLLKTRPSPACSVQFWAVVSAPNTLNACYSSSNSGRYLTISHGTRPPTLTKCSARHTRGPAPRNAEPDLQGEWVGPNWSEVLDFVS